MGEKRSLAAGKAGAAVWGMVLNNLARWIGFESD